MEFQERKRWVFLGLPFTFTKYIVKEDMITIDTGFWKKVENDCYMYKVQDVQLSASLGERMARLGTITCFTGDTTHQEFKGSKGLYSGNVRGSQIKEKNGQYVRYRVRGDG